MARLRLPPRRRLRARAVGNSAGSTGTTYSLLAPLRWYGKWSRVDEVQERRAVPEVDRVGVRPHRPLDVLTVAPVPSRADPAMGRSEGRWHARILPNVTRARPCRGVWASRIVQAGPAAGNPRARLRGARVITDARAGGVAECGGRPARAPATHSNSTAEDVPPAPTATHTSEGPAARVSGVPACICRTRRSVTPMVWSSRRSWRPHTAPACRARATGC